MSDLGCLPGGQPPVPPGVRAAGPDRKNRDLIRPVRPDGYGAVNGKGAS
jgi:hypothetical protein